MTEEPIVERTFYLEGDSKENPALVFRLLKPHQVSGEYPRCAYELATTDGVQRREVPGVDELDCIISCLSQAGSEIAGLNEAVFNGRLRWEAWSEGDRGLGLPTIEDHWPLRESYQAALQWSRDQQ